MDMLNTIKDRMGQGDPPAAIARDLGITEEHLHELIKSTLPESNDVSDHKFLERIHWALRPGELSHRSIEKAMKRFASTGDVGQFMDDASPAVVIELVGMALGCSDDRTKLAAIKDVLDRSQGRPAQTIDINNRYDSMTRDEMIAKARSHVLLLDDPNIHTVVPEDVTDKDDSLGEDGDN